MALEKIKDNIYSVGAVDWDRRLFDELIPLPEGTTYNSYLIIGSEKIALIDTVDPSKEDILFNNLKKLNIENIDYLIPNHGEQDHSGTLPKLIEKYPEAKVVTNIKCKEFLKDLLHIEDSKFQVVNDGDTLSLGDKNLQFFLTPWVHWPETQVTYLKEDKILFSCDFFGSHYSYSSIFYQDDEIINLYAKRYYAEIMMPFRIQIRKNIEKIEKLDIQIIAPSHGPLRMNPKSIIDCYKDWISDNVKKEVIIPYVSMHGSTEIMIKYLIDKLIEGGLKVVPFNLSKTDIGELAMALVDASTIIVGSPQVLASAHPASAFALFLVNVLRPKTKFVGIVGSYSWGGRMIDHIKEMIPNLKVELFEPVFIKGKPKENDFKLLDNLAKQIIEKNNI